MEVKLAPRWQENPSAIQAKNIISKCVHCGFCTATCPTYQLLGDELDSPRGRIYLIKQVLEGKTPTAKTQLHLDRCLTCRACETTCPSGVQYGKLVDIGRDMVNKHVAQPFPHNILRWTLRHILPYPSRFTPLFKMGQLLRRWLPNALKKMLPLSPPIPRTTTRPHPRTMLLFEGCVQPAIAPHFNALTIRLFDRLGIQLIPASGCCGAVSYHLAATEEGLAFMRRNIDAWWASIQAGAEAIVVNASGCGALLKEYGHILAQDAEYAEKAKIISSLTKDVSEILAQEDLSRLQPISDVGKPIAFHSPCSLQHGQQLSGQVEVILRKLGFQLTSVPDAHLCCGSAGTYAILQPAISKQLLHNKLIALQSGKPELIATANIGCWSHLATEATIPVIHWLELLEKQES